METKQDIFDEISKMMVTLFDLPKEDIKYDSRLYEDLNLDSIDAIDLITEFQSKLGRRIDPADFKMVRKVGDIVEVAEKIISKK